MGDVEHVDTYVQEHMPFTLYLVERHPVIRPASGLS
jgi:hypothetical protein